MDSLTERMFDAGVFQQKYNGIIEIYPTKAMNSDVFDAALRELSKTHDIVKLLSGWLRAFERPNNLKER